MFTGLVEDTGSVVSVRPLGNGVELRLRTKIALEQVEMGASIAVNGVCLTVESVDGDCFTATAGIETLKLTTTGGLKAGSTVHLEQALRVGDRLGGHLVQGHVDGVGRVHRIERQRESMLIWIEMPADLSRYVAAKGSICIDGVSLTVNDISGRIFRVNIVPHTTEVTRLGAFSVDNLVNLEVDILAKYVERMLLGDQDSDGITPEKLRRYGFKA